MPASHVYELRLASGRYHFPVASSAIPPALFSQSKNTTFISTYLNFHSSMRLQSPRSTSLPTQISTAVTFTQSRLKLKAIKQFIKTPRQQCKNVVLINGLIRAKFSVVRSRSGCAGVKVAKLRALVRERCVLLVPINSSLGNIFFK